MFLLKFFSDIPMSVGIVDPRANPTQLNTVEFLWDPSKRTSVFIQVSYFHVVFIKLCCTSKNITDYISMYNSGKMLFACL